MPSLVAFDGRRGDDASATLPPETKRAGAHDPARPELLEPTGARQLRKDDARARRTELGRLLGADVADPHGDRERARRGATHLGGLAVREEAHAAVLADEEFAGRQAVGEGAVAGEPDAVLADRREVPGGDRGAEDLASGVGDLDRGVLGERL